MTHSALEPGFQASSGFPTVSDMLAHQLREMILSGQIAPGARLQQNDVAKQFKVSTTPVREAFAELAREGLVIGAAHRGVEVVNPTETDVLEAAEVQELVEGACLTSSVPLLTDTDLATARRLLDEHRANSPDQRRRGLDLDNAFHLSFLVRCPNSRLRALAENARRDTMTHRLMLVPVDEPSGQVVRTIHRQHEAIYKAAASRDGAEAAERTIEHISWVASGSPVT